MKIRKDQKAVEVNLKSRRMFLKSASGLTLAIPLLPSILTLTAEKALAQVAVVPQRYVGIVNPFGGLQNKNWFGTNLPTTSLPLYTGHNGKIGQISSLVGINGLSPVLDSSFQNLWSYSNVIVGADQPHYFGHNRSVAFGAFAPPTPGYESLSDQFSFAGKGGLAGNIPSVDQVFAHAGGNGIYGNDIGSRKRIVNIGSGSISFGRNDYFSPDDPVVNQDRINSTAGVFTYLFGSASPNQPTNQNANPLIALINEFWPSGKSIYRFLSTKDRQSLDQLFDLAQQTATQYSKPIPACDKTVSSVLNTNSWDTSKASELNLMAEIIALAFKCDITRIVNVSMSTATPQGKDWHAISHAPDAGFDAGQDDQVIIHKMFSQNFVSKLGQNLLVTDPFDSGSTILKNSMIVWSHENKAAHDNYCQPYFMMGSAGGRIKTGLLVDLRNKDVAPFGTDVVGDPKYKGDIINRMWATMLHGMRIPPAQYEIQRGGTDLTQSLFKGYGHIIKQDQWYYDKVNHNLSKIGDPWEFLINA